VENYVKFLTDHMRSVLRNAIKRRGVQSFYADAIQVIRDTVLGESGEDGKRKGRAFPENGMRIYDVEVLDVTLGDAQIENMLTQAQHAVVSQTLELAAERRELEFVKESERLKREIMETQSTTLARELELREQEITKRLTVRLTELGAEREAQSKRLEAKREEQQALEGINTLELQIKKAQADVALSVEEAKLLQRIKEVEADVAAVVSKANAVSPDLVAALQAFSDRAMVERVSESMAPLAILGGGSVAEVVSNLLKGTALEQVTRYLPDPSSSRDDEESE
jgi:major vault protein